MPDLRAGHALQRGGTAGKDARKVGRDGVVEPGDAVGEDSGDRSGERSGVPSGRTEERLERLLDHGGERPERVLHGGVPGMSCHIYYFYIFQKLLSPRRADPNVLTIEKGGEYPGPSRGHLPMLYALPVLSPEFVQLARLEVYRVNSTHRGRIGESLELRRQAGFLKDSVRPQFGPSEAHIGSGEVSDLIEGAKIF